MYQRYMINVQYISDIHLELLNDREREDIIRQIRPYAPILVLAGDIGFPFHLHYYIFLREMSRRFKKVFVIAGNHEFYTQEFSVQQVKQRIQLLCNQFSNVSFLSNSYEDYEGYRWIGSTLWSLLSSNATHRLHGNIDQVIQGVDNIEYNRMHLESITFLTSTLETTYDLPCIIITHHLPSKWLIHDKYMKSKYYRYHEWYASNLDFLIHRYSDMIAAWFFGHSHEPFDDYLYNVRFLSNPVGYKDERQDVDYNQVVSL